MDPITLSNLIITSLLAIERILHYFFRNIKASECCGNCCFFVAKNGKNGDEKEDEKRKRKSERKSESKSKKEKEKKNWRYRKKERKLTRCKKSCLQGH